MKTMRGKLAALRAILRPMRSALLAYSGGVDSVFLMAVAREVLGDTLIAVTANSPTYPAEELHFARSMASALGVAHLVIETCEIHNRDFSSNSADRCYYCKQELFSRLTAMARRRGIHFVLDATNRSDRDDFRPGQIAKKEYGVRSPLDEAGLTKDDIRCASRKLGLPTWNKPAMACLASRVPYGSAITVDVLSRINTVETAIERLGFPLVRCRHYGDLCRIEVDRRKIGAAVRARDAILHAASNAGYKYVTIDLAGYRQGSMNETLAAKTLLNPVKHR